MREFEGNKKVVHGDVVHGDKISVGDIRGSYNAMGAGAQVIVNQIQEAHSAIDELEKEIRAAERRLNEAIQKRLERYTGLTEAPEVDARENPYKALLNYRIEDAPFFYGRSEATGAMLEKIGQNPLTVLYSDSGSGKTSLLQAGVASRLLAEGHFPLHLRPYRQPPAQFIKKAFLPDYATQPELERFHDERMSLRGFLERVSHYLGERRLCIFLDQFEEFFAEVKPPGQQLFAGQLQECVHSDLPVRWVLALRKESFADLLRLFQPLQPYENRYFLPTFRLEEAQQVITEPAALKGVAYEEGLVGRMLKDIRQEEEGLQPAQVQLVCYTLFSEMAEGGGARVISSALYDQPRGRKQAPGAEGILTSHLSRVLKDKLSGPERKLAFRVLEELVSSDLRRVVKTRERLLKDLVLEQPEMLDDVLPVLHDNRLVRRELDEEDRPAYELAHDYLLGEIEIDPENQARKAAQELLAQEVEAYVKHGKLLSKDGFDIINSQRGSLKLDSVDKELLDKSQEQHEAEAARLRRRLYYVAGALVVAAIAAVLAIFFAISARNNEEMAQNNLATATAALIVAATSEDEAAHQRDVARAESTRAVQESTRAYRQQLVAEEASTRAISGEATATVSLATAVAAEEEARRQAMVAQAQYLAVESGRVLERTGDTELATLLALEANHLNEEAGGSARALVDSSLREGLSRPFFHTTLSKLRRNHDGATKYSLVFSPDGRWLLHAGNDDTIQLWDLSDPAKSPEILVGHTDLVSQADFSPDGQTVASAGLDGTVRLWSLEDLSEPVTVLAEGDNGYRGVAYSNDGSALAASVAEEGCVIWSTDDLSATPIRLSDGCSFPGGLAISGDGRWVAASGKEDPLLLWQLEDLQSGPLVLPAGDSAIYDLAFAPDDQMLVGGSDDGSLLFWAMDDPLAEPVVARGHESAVSSVAFDQPGDRLATASYDGTIKLWSMEDENVAQGVIVSPRGWVNAVVFSPDGNRLVSTGDDNTIKVWSLLDPPGAPGILPGSATIVNNLSRSPDNRWLAADMGEGDVRLWPLADPSAEPIRLDGESGVNAVHFSPNGQWLVVGHGNGMVRLWSTADLAAGPQEIEAVHGLLRYVTGVAISPDNKRLATGGWDEKILLWSMADLSAPTASFPGHSSYVGDLAFSPDGHYLASGGHDGVIRLWPAGAPFSLPQELVWHDGIIRRLAFSPDGQWLAAASGDTTVSLWSLDDLSQPEHVLSDHGSDVSAVIFSEDGLWLVTASLDGTIRMWSLVDLERPPVILSSPEGAVYDVVAAADGRWLYSGTGDGDILVWPMLETLVEMACPQVARNLSQQEWQQYLPGEDWRPTCAGLPQRPSVLGE